MQEIEALCANVVNQAVELHASDIHIVPKEHYTEVLYRIDDDLLKQQQLPRDVSQRLISHLKFEASMDIGERRKPQSGALSIALKDLEIPIRLSTLPTIYEESMVIRLLSSDKVPRSSRISLFPSATKKLLSFFYHSHGLMIFTGPTGSGKTTTLYSLLNHAKKHFNRNIITLEDPVEARNQEMMQVQVNEKAGITYASGLRAILRHDPDIIMVGEIRDSETAKIAIRASLTGHLVLSTMHTRNAKGALYRLLEFGVPQAEIEQTLIAVSAQRLVEIKCPFCTGKCSPFCKKMRKVRKAAVFELLYGKNLAAAFKETRGEEEIEEYPTLKDVIKKGIALGFLSSSAYHRWIFSNED
ncbi:MULTISPECIES: competence type IV pilus ATPase ComGA [Bacillaceae]|uniref:Competence type IV pilus ATPase ComGA n=1 Tax=Metabacillus sediminis TaxID=3117746 RepID=A0ABZ2ND57_9BACI|nr:competence type IV pilus ATPase ComGA [Bacillus sp. SJS]KZZ86303.1 competence protein ComG [Bacillus sp. SJS]